MRASMDARSLTRRGAAALIGAGLLSRALARADAPDPQGEMEALHTGVDLEARLTTPVWLNGQGPYPFVVDTGSNRSILAEDLAEALHLPVADPVMVNTVAGAERAASVFIQSLDVGQRGGRPVVTAVAPRAAIGGVGLLGIDQLDNLRLTLNFRDRSLAVGRSGRRSADGAALAVRAQQRSGQLTLVGARVGDMPVIAFVDSGSEGTIGNLALRRALGQRVRFAKPGQAALQAPIIGATGLQITGDVGVLPILTVGGLTVRYLPAIFADLHTFHVWGLDDAPALLIGVDLLRRFASVDLDFGRGEVLFRVPGSGAITGSRIPGAGSDIVRSLVPRG